ncbi:hypothetical protein [Microcella sp.]|uniref:hypothetical protein n=1 Tax=Microcella sp. TaxID=1913979 RepID=UPI00345B9173
MCDSVAAAGRVLHQLPVRALCSLSECTRVPRLRLCISTSTLKHANLLHSVIEGRETAFAKSANRVALVVNVASRCGAVPPYEQLEQLRKTSDHRGFAALGLLRTGSCTSYRASRRPPSTAVRPGAVPLR